MLKKFLSIAVMSSLFSSGAFAEDLLAKITNGAVSDTSKGVRLLSTEEEKQVVGGYNVGFIGGGNEIHAIMIPSDYEWNTFKQEGNYRSIQLCGEGQSRCANPSSRRGQDWLATTGGNPYQLIGFSVKMNVGYSRNGRYTYFSYGTAVYNAVTGTAYSTRYMPNNLIVKEIRNRYQNAMEVKFY